MHECGGHPAELRAGEIAEAIELRSGHRLRETLDSLLFGGAIEINGQLTPSTRHVSNARLESASCGSQGVIQSKGGNPVDAVTRETSRPTKLGRTVHQGERTHYTHTERGA